MKRIALIAVIAALLGGTTAFAADPCACKGQKCAQDAAGSDARNVYDGEFNQTDLTHRW